ncbi:MAG: NAD-dependent epimerase/dehydratase family protein [Promethearchaeota archaeon]
MVTWIDENLGFAPCDIKLGQGVSLLDVRDLIDRKGNDLAIVRNKIQVGADILRSGRKLVVCCDKGISRSAAVSIGILSLLGKSFDNSLKLVEGKIKDQSLNLDLLDDIKKCIDPEAGKKSKGQKTSKLLVTGGTGFIGTIFVERLCNKYSFFSPARVEIDLAKDVLPLYREVKNREIDLIIDFAHPRLRNSLQSLSQSIVMVRNILEVSRLNDVPLIFLSSLDVFEGYHDDVSDLKSNLKPKPTSIFGQSKALCEELIRVYREVYGLNVTTLRLPYVYGKVMNQPNFFWKTITNASRNASITVHRYLNGFQQFDFLYISDLIDAIENSIRFVPSEDINLGTGKRLSTMDVAKLIITLTNSESKINIIDVEDFTTNLIPNTKEAQEIYDRLKTRSSSN